MKKHLAMLALLSVIPMNSAHALAISADTNATFDAQYGETVLNAILENWQKPQENAIGRTAVIIRLTNDGRPYSCEVRQQSSSAAMDNSICTTVAKIGQFPAPAANTSGEVYLTFVHDNKAFLQDNTQNLPASQEAETITGNEQVDDISNPIENPLKEIQQSSQVEINSAPLTETALSESAAAPADTIMEVSAEKAAEVPAQMTETEQTMTKAAEASNMANTADKPAAEKQPSSDIAPSPAAPNSVASNSAASNSAAPSPESLLATEPQPETLVISKEEALLPPSANLVNPATTVQEYSTQILKMATPKIRIPSNISGQFKVVCRLNLLADGTLKDAIITKSSQNTTVDNKVLDVLKNEIQYPPLPTKTDQSLWLTFNITK